MSVCVSECLCVFAVRTDMDIEYGGMSGNGHGQLKTQKGIN